MEDLRVNELDEVNKYIYEIMKAVGCRFTIKAWRISEELTKHLHDTVMYCLQPRDK